MKTIQQHQEDIRTNILSNIKGSGVLTLSSEVLEKAVKEQGLEVYTDEGITKYLGDIRKGILSGNFDREDLEKAKLDTGKLIKVIEVDKSGRKHGKWIKRGDEEKEGKKVSSIDKVWWSMDKKEKNEYLTASRSKDNAKIEEFKNRMVGKYGEKKESSKRGEYDGEELTDKEKEMGVDFAYEDKPKKDIEFNDESKRVKKENREDEELQIIVNSKEYKNKYKEYLEGDVKPSQKSREDAHRFAFNFVKKKGGEKKTFGSREFDRKYKAKLKAFKQR